MKKGLLLRLLILCKQLNNDKSLSFSCIPSSITIFVNSMSLHDLNYRNDELLGILHSYVMKMKKKLNIYYLSLILNAYARLAPDQLKYLSELGPELHDRLAAAVNTETFRAAPTTNLLQLVEEYIPDLTAYKNLWLAITCFGVKSNIQAENLDQEDQTAGTMEEGQEPRI